MNSSNILAWTHLLHKYTSNTCYVVDIFHSKFQKHHNFSHLISRVFNMDTFFDVHASVPAEVWTLGQLNAQKANLINTMEAAKSRVFNSNQQIRLSHQESIVFFIIPSFINSPPLNLKFGFSSSILFPLYLFPFFLTRTSSVTQWRASISHLRYDPQETFFLNK